MIVAKLPAPFAPGGSAAIDSEVCRKLLAVALSRGGDYADLFFEYRAAGGFVFDEGILQQRLARRDRWGSGSASSRATRRATPTPRTSSWDAMKRAAETAARIASRRQGAAGRPSNRRRAAQPLRARAPDPRRRRGSTSALCSSAPARRRSRTTRAIVKVEATFAEEIREILVVTSDGRLAHDVQPLMRFGVRAIAEHGTASARRVAAAAAGG